MRATERRQQLELPVISIKRSSTSDAKITDNSVPDTPTSDVLPDRKRTRVNVESPLGAQPFTVAEPPLGARTPIATSLQHTIIPQTTEPIYAVPQTKSIITLTTPAIDSKDLNNDAMDDMVERERERDKDRTERGKAQKNTTQLIESNT
ncbi:unnamed protein product [Didymodactylos carnosus]|uniref:Uncharacterized protein n=1 Tax=Didymodactylos carnosus TaxID=1234261 RepID=A0A8S2E4U7_9BILA|nr:unnamed protein product [Didymodactylos carnosus]CAF3829958.1 unnamed protein product [Didymodactylos carnosus]